MTSTAGPGVSLMAEFAGLGYYAEVPAVIFDIQRGGPSTGLPTRTGQQDILSTAVLSHGDTNHPMLLPASVTECYTMAMEAFDLAEQLQTPVFVMSDLDLGMNTWMAHPFDYPTAPLARGKQLTPELLQQIGLAGQRPLGRGAADVRERVEGVDVLEHDRLELGGPTVVSRPLQRVQRVREGLRREGMTFVGPVSIAEEVERPIGVRSHDRQEVDQLDSGRDGQSAQPIGKGRVGQRARIPGESVALEEGTASRRDLMAGGDVDQDGARPRATRGADDGLQIPRRHPPRVVVVRWQEDGIREQPRLDQGQHP